MDDFAERTRAVHLARVRVRARVRAIRRHDTAGVDVMRGLMLTWVGGAVTAPAEPLTDRADWFVALADVFDLRLDAVPARAPRPALGSLPRHGILEWEAAGRP